MKERKARLQNVDLDLIYNALSILWNIKFHAKSFANWCKLQLVCFNLTQQHQESHTPINH